MGAWMAFCCLAGIVVGVCFVWGQKESRALIFFWSWLITTGILFSLGAGIADLANCVPVDRGYVPDAGREGPRY